MAVLINLDTHYKKHVVRGIIQFTKTHNNWALYGQNQILHNLSDLKKWKGNGIIAHIATKQEADKLTSLGLPIIDVCGSVNINYDHLVQYTNDDVLTGSRIAQHFMLAGFTEFAFIGARQRKWSLDRKNGFINAIPKSHPGALVFERPLAYWNTYTTHRDLLQWLKNRPLAPLSIMAANDQIGAQVINACNAAKIDLPNEISIIGTDNNEVVCEFCNPPLSSIPLDCLQIGLQAATSLHELMSSRNREPADDFLKLPPLPIVLRGSSSFENVNNLPVQDAVNFIRRNKGIALTVADVVEHCKVGRRTLEINFKKICGHSIYEEICQQKIQRSCVLLQRSDISITEIAFDSGFNSYQRFHSFFRKYMDTTPKNYRKKYRINAHIAQ